MDRYVAVLESPYVGADQEFDFYMPEDADYWEIQEEAKAVIYENISWHVLDDDGRELND